MSGNYRANQFSMQGNTDMSEPLDPITQQRLRDTEAQKARVRMVDMPTYFSPLNGTLHIRPRPIVVPALSPTARPTQAPEPVAPVRNNGSTRRPIDVSADRVLAVAAVCHVWPIVTANDIASLRRSWFVVEARYAACALVQQLCPAASSSDMGRAFNRDHASVLVGLRKHAERMADPDYASKFEQARALIRTALPSCDTPEAEKRVKSTEGAASCDISPDPSPTLLPRSSHDKPTIGALTRVQRG